MEPQLGGIAAKRTTEDVRLVSFLYILMRDHLPAGTVEGIVVEHVPVDTSEGVFTNPFLAEYAQNVARRIR